MTQQTEDRPGVDARMGELRRILRQIGSAVVAFSGGVDSTFLLRVCADELDDLLAVTARSPSYTQEEYESACRLAGDFGVRHLTIETDELSDPNFSQNPPERCYHCKGELFGRLKQIAAGEGLNTVLDASNADDLSDFRPGRRAAHELGVRSPLVEAGITKNDIRLLSRRLGLPTWNKPSMACLASRFPYGEPITAEKLERVGAAERFLRELGFEQVRVRSHGDLARIEVRPEQVHQLTGPDVREHVARRLRDLGFVYVAVDLSGYRTGSLNETLTDDQKA